MGRTSSRRSNDNHAAVPIYRYPADDISLSDSPFSPAVARICDIVEQRLLEITGSQQRCNHVLLQLYRDGFDHISEHADKTLDIVPSTVIATVSLGASRTMCLRTKRDAAMTGCADAGGAGGHHTAPRALTLTGDNGENRTDQRRRRRTGRITLPHNSLFLLGPRTNMRWLHGIKSDKRAAVDRTAAENAYHRVRISLTFRTIGTFVDPARGVIWGQGAVSKTWQGAQPFMYGGADECETRLLLGAFSDESRFSNFDWDATYGKGFNVVGLAAACPPALSRSPAVAALIDRMADVPRLRIMLSLLECEVRLDSIRASAALVAPQAQLAAAPEVAEEVAILADINDHTATQTLRCSPEEIERHVIEADLLWRSPDRSAQHHLLDRWEAHLRGQPSGFLEGGKLSMQDCILWPALRHVFGNVQLGHRLPKPLRLKYPALELYYHKIGKRGCTREALRSLSSQEADEAQ
ncbi:hypothetical protein KEM52_000118 [Ascosphaera acerosa]|nr:hypothetical protein KEM52_000118 [Ascosphaera acerosa]